MPGELLHRIVLKRNAVVNGGSKAISTCNGFSRYYCFFFLLSPSGGFYSLSDLINDDLFFYTGMLKIPHEKNY